MIIRMYDRRASADLATKLATAPRWAATPAVAAGGGWQARTWRADLAAAAPGRPQPPARFGVSLVSASEAKPALAVLDVRANPGEPAPSNYDWATIARHLVHHCGWHGQPWVAVRLDPHTMTLLAAVHRQPSQAAITAAAAALQPAAAPGQDPEQMNREKPAADRPHPVGLARQLTPDAATTTACPPAQTTTCRSDVPVTGPAQHR